MKKRIIKFVICIILGVLFNITHKSIINYYILSRDVDAILAFITYTGSVLSGLLAYNLVYVSDKKETIIIPHKGKVK